MSVTIVNLSRNFGHQMATGAGFPVSGASFAYAGYSIYRAALNGRSLPGATAPSRRERAPRRARRLRGATS